MMMAVVSLVVGSHVKQTEECCLVVWYLSSIALLGTGEDVDELMGSNGTRVALLQESD